MFFSECGVSQSKYKHAIPRFFDTGIGGMCVPCIVVTGVLCFIASVEIHIGYDNDMAVLVTHSCSQLGYSRM